MKFVIWGAGMFGRRFNAFVGDMALAFIDSKPSYQGTKRDGLPVYSYEACCSQGLLDDPDTWILVTPRDFSDDIVSFLQAKHVQKYFVLSGAVRNFFDRSLQEMIDFILRKYESAKEIHLIGLDCFHAVLYQGLLAVGKHPVIWVSEKDWEKEEQRIVCLNWDIRCGDGEPKSSVRDVELLAKTQNVYRNPAIAKFRNMYAGKRCFIVATGPSLRMEDLETLREHQELCISMNGIFHAFPNVKWRPDFFVMVDFLLAKYSDVIDRMDDVPYKLIADSDTTFWDKEHPDSVYRVHCIGGTLDSAKTSFSEDLVQGVFGNATVTNACIQLAVYLGCKEIYLIGVDFYQLLGVEGRVTHFTDAYDDEVTSDDFSKFYTDELVKQLMWKGYRVSREYADTHPPLKIYNATRGGHLEVFERVDFDSLF